MSDDDVQQYRRLATAFRERDLDGFLSIFAPDADFAPRSTALDSDGPFHGHEGIRRWWAGMFAIVSDYQAEIDEIRDLGDVTFSRVRLIGHGIESGAPFEQTQWHVVEWQGGTIRRWRTLGTEAEALEAAGLSG